MKKVFVDTLYWVAVARPNDPWKAAAKQAKARLGQVRMITTDAVLAEFLNSLAEGGPELRMAAVDMADRIMANANVRVLAQTREIFLAGMKRYRERKDKGYSVTDCISMNVMDGEGIREVLTHDHHFEQEGMEVLIKGKPT